MVNFNFKSSIVNIFIYTSYIQMFFLFYYFGVEFAGIRN